MTNSDLPSVQALNDILPREPVLLMGAGPVPISNAVARANSVVINHIGSTMGNVIEGLSRLAQYVFQTKSDKIIGVSGPSSAAMEMAIVNLLGKGRTALILDNGTFSHRWADMAARVGSEVTSIISKDIEPISAKQVSEAFEQQTYDVVIITHGETSSGVITTELPAIAAVAKRHGALVIVDAVTTLGASEFDMDAWQLDAVVAGGQKALGSIPGVSLVAFSTEAWEYIESEKQTQKSHWCLDALLAWQFWGFHEYHYTAPVPGILSLYEALYEIKEESLTARWTRHEVSSSAMQKSVEAMGLKLFVPAAYRLASVISVSLPDGTDSKELRRFMVDKFSVEIAGAFGHNIVRIGQMGEQCRAHNLFKTIYALGMAFSHCNAVVDVPGAMAVLEQGLATNKKHLLVQ
ncbi:MAG: alanine--glyoxylate aminotransferase family protein [Patescibacteria group bacterium]